jgi:outer membrane autotransporter protein
MKKMLLACMASSMVGSVQAAGNLIYLGETVNSTAMWLSILDGTDSGEYRLEAANKNWLENWDQAGAHLKISESTELSNGSGITHKLFDRRRQNALDQQNQRNPVFDEIIDPPWGLLPPILPPIDHPIEKPKPPIDKPEPPVGIIPPIEKPRPPIDKPEPPVGIIPPIEKPRPPIDKPEPPVGIIPPIEKPKPPIDKPEPPVGIIPPIEKPRPPIDKPEPPVGIIPPIEKPKPPIDKPEPPDNSLPPPDRPEPEHPIENPDLPDERPDSPRSTERRNQGTAEAIVCPQKAEDLGKVLLDERYKHCFEDTKAGGYENLPSITERREFDDGRLWNTWADARINRRTNSNYLQDIDTDGGVVAFGVDKRLENDMVAGFIVNIESSETDGFSGQVTFDSDGFNIGPYVGWRLDDTWTMDASLMYGWYDNSVRILMFNGDYDSTKLTTMLNLSGQFFTEDDIRIKPKFSLNYTRTENDAYTLFGTIGGINNPALKETVSRTSSFKFGSEFSKRYLDEKGLVTEPVFEIAVDYQIEEWGTADVDDPWSGEIRGGIRRQLNDATFIKLDAGYSSIGQDNIDEWDVGLFYSYSF